MKATLNYRPSIETLEDRLTPSAFASDFDINIAIGWGDTMYLNTHSRASEVIIDETGGDTLDTVDVAYSGAYVYGRLYYGFAIGIAESSAKIDDIHTSNIDMKIRQSTAEINIFGFGFGSFYVSAYAGTAGYTEFNCCGDYISTTAQFESAYAGSWIYVSGWYSISVDVESGQIDSSFYNDEIDAIYLDQGYATANIDIAASYFRASGSTSSYVYSDYSFGYNGDMTSDYSYSYGFAYIYAYGYGGISASAESEWIHALGYQGSDFVRENHFSNQAGVETSGWVYGYNYLGSYSKYYNTSSEGWWQYSWLSPTNNFASIETEAGGYSHGKLSVLDALFASRDDVLTAI